MIDNATRRKLDGWIREIEIIEEECAGNKGRTKRKELDEFTRSKLELNEVLNHIKDDIKTKQGLEERLGETGESVKLKHKIKRELEEANRLQQNMELAYKESERAMDTGDSIELKSDDLDQRQELMALMKQDLEFTENEFAPRDDDTAGGGRFKVAQKARDRRKKKRDDGLMSSEPQPLTAKQQGFIQESIRRDAELDEKLDVILSGVKQLNQIGQDINEELDKQSLMLDETERRLSHITEKLQQRNAQIKKLLDDSGGAARW
eukprot:CAMPEP_0202712762 /NCGR_PEP_ID=MMETSP1385-20130828/45113_1 /ASSEMBLY_ACC=CAM_ASM_000861 /TAXON_ID=933848 /ORGANISM="Elphidium margaritaceum" /LENGTH=262 /DNA_ID=CAMNT_0049372891 /DNA_START=75 /DNA_END=860 /DNA_ORIENTATION=-